MLRSKRHKLIGCVDVQYNELNCSITISGEKLYQSLISNSTHKTTILNNKKSCLKITKLTVAAQ